MAKRAGLLRAPLLGYVRNVKEPKSVAERALRASYAMRALATESGGRAFKPKRASELPPIYRAISSELTFQYVLGYVPTRPADGVFRRVAVRVLPPASATARTRTGYVSSQPRTTAQADRAAGTGADGGLRIWQGVAPFSILRQ